MSAAAAMKSRFVVLAALDQSGAAREVLRVAANLARAPGGELHLIHVVENLPPPAPIVPPPIGLGITAGELGAAARRYLNESAAEARREYEGRLTTHVAAGSAGKQILQLAIDIQADVILVGTSRRTSVKRMLLGSVAEAVVRKASCPVVVVREKDYHAFVPPEVEPACPDCVVTQQHSDGATLWCPRHAEHRPHPRLHYEVPEGFAAGSQLLRP